MKTFKIPAIIGIIGTTLLLSTSCTKEYVCQCKKTYTRSDGTTITENDGNYTYDDNKLYASNRCNAQEGQDSDLYGEYVRNCELK